MARSLAFAASVAALGLVIAPASAQGPVAHRFDPVSFFSGTTEGVGQLHKALGKMQATHVSGHGSVQRDGSLVLEQKVEIAGDKPRQREWRLREVAPGRFSGTLSDADGPVVATVDGRVLTIRYTARDGGLGVEQTITLDPGGRSAHNRMRLRKFGITVARLDEDIRKL